MSRGIHSVGSRECTGKLGLFFLTDERGLEQKFQGDRRETATGRNSRVPFGRTNKHTLTMSKAGAKSKDYDYLFKLVLIGDSGVGKSCLLLRFAVSSPEHMKLVLGFGTSTLIPIEWPSICRTMHSQSPIFLQSAWIFDFELSRWTTRRLSCRFGIQPAK